MGEFRPTQVFIAADHGGFAAKQALVGALSRDFKVQDFGPETLDPGDDFTPYAEAVSRAVVKTPGSMGILVCRSGEGMVMAANKIDGIRAALAWNEEVAHETRSDNDSNVLSLPADHTNQQELEAIARAWLTTPFAGTERYKRRIDEITKLEESN